MNAEVVARASVVELERLRPMWRIYAGMLFQRSSDFEPGEQVPSVVYRQRDVRADEKAVAEYRHVCGEAPPAQLPPMFPHVLATPLQINLLDSDDFPLSLAGLVHLGQVVEWHQPLHVDDVLDIECGMRGPEDSDLGWMFRLETRVLRAGECAWREEIAFLKPDPERRVRPKRRSRDDAAHFVPLLHVQFTEDIGRRYAKVSGDWNPIHLWPFTAKFFGFRRPIAHGMYSLARCLSIFQARGIEFTGRRLDAQFRAPVMLPAFTNFCLSEKHPDEAFALTDARKGRILVEGRMSVL